MILTVAQKCLHGTVQTLDLSTEGIRVWGIPLGENGAEMIHFVSNGNSNTFKKLLTLLLQSLWGDVSVFVNCEKLRKNSVFACDVKITGHSLTPLIG